MNTQTVDVAIIGAGPSGAIASALLKQQGISVCVLEKAHFPRFVIGESLLPHCMEFIEAAGFLPAVEAESRFQFKNGAAFTWQDRYTEIDFTDKFTAGRGTTFQVRRDIFDQILINEAIKQGVEVRFGHSLNAFNNTGEQALLSIESETGTYTLQAGFVLDASGYGRVLPRLLDLETPSALPLREAHFTHIQDNISDRDFDRNKILISTHSYYRDVWLWLIPFSDNRCSIGVVGLPERFATLGNSENILRCFASEVPKLNHLLRNAKWENDFPFRHIQGYSANVKTLYGKHFALLGNAAEFLDPVFSSGVTIAMHSAKLAADLLIRQHQGEIIDWEKDFSQALMLGVNTFRTYVNGWYDGSFQDVIYAPNRSPEITQMISAILAGYAWDKQNPFVEKSERRLQTLVETIRQSA